MAGIYIHIPFCKSKCYYCDFHTSASFKHKDIYVKSLLEEITQKKNFITEKEIETVYFGGGTPSTINTDDILKIITKIKSSYTLNQNAEITLEANPDDLTEEYLESLLEIGINRLSIGIQSFSGDYLKLMNRRHNSNEAINAVKKAQKIGFKNISVDLIYGLPKSNLDFLKTEADKILSLDVQHISAYHLTIEDKTSFKKFVRNGKIREITDTISREQFLYLNKFFEKNGFEHYEISNFAKKGFVSKHNSSYWFNKQYLGIGSSAHSYNIQERMWNIASLIKYIEGVKEKSTYFEKEMLSKKDMFNDYLLTGLRTKWGIDIKYIESEFGRVYKDYIIKNVNKYNDVNTIFIKENKLFLSKIGWFTSDSLILDLILDEEI